MSLVIGLCLKFYNLLIKQQDTIPQIKIGYNLKKIFLGRIQNNDLKIVSLAEKQIYGTWEYFRKNGADTAMAVFIMPLDIPMVILLIPARKSVHRKTGKRPFGSLLCSPRKKTIHHRTRIHNAFHFHQLQVPIRIFS
ncbi:MAG: hypothetical protein HUN04_12300 [Desulfobacter sp.]|nr:MAG: hypothetical protein HUN04_12300 [Desulfobacter sp.]